MAHPLNRVAIVALLAGCAGGHPVVGVSPAAPSQVRQDVEFLASDALLGRQTPGPGVEIAASYIETQLRMAGLDPLSAPMRSHYPFPLLAPDSAAARLVVNGRSLAFGTDYTVLAGGGPAGAAGRVHDAGALPGVLQSRALDSARLSGIVVFRLPGYPGSQASQVATLARDLAARRGATGAIFVVDSTVPSMMMRHAARLAAEPRREQRAASGGIPSAFVKDARAVRELLQGASVTLAAPSRVVSADSGPNVVAMLRGSDPSLRDEYVVVSAHFDHVGVNPSLPDSIFNGADDNASGTAALLEAARILGALPTTRRPKRSIIFLAVSGEEHGLLGSGWFVDHAPVPLDRIVAAINLDMVGRNSPDSVEVIGLELSSLGDDARAVAPAASLVVTGDPRPEERRFTRSDHYMFARRDIPAVMLSGGSHPDYHAPGDESARIEFTKVERVARLAAGLAVRVADATLRPQWTAAGRTMIRR